MFRLHYKLFLNICAKNEKTKSWCLNLVFYKNTLAIQENVPKSKKSFQNYHHDALDVYTSTLVLENISKWKTYKFSTSIKLSKTKPNSIFKSCDDPDRLILYLQRCLDGYCKVSESTLFQIMLTMARHGRINGLVLTKRLNEKYGYCIKNSELQMNFAEAYWTNGKLDDMFKTFETFYPVYSMKVNHVLEPIICTIVNSRGGASVVMVLKFVNSIVIKHGDYYPMCILWKYLFLSKLYDDNKEAEELLRLNSNLFHHIQYLVSFITNTMLKEHNIDCVQRLMILLLKQNQMDLYQWVVRSLFEYYCK